MSDIWTLRSRAVRRLGRGTVVVAALTLAGCSVLGPTPDGSRYFLLRSLAEPSASPAMDDLVLGLGPITMPDYLEGVEMLDLVGPYELSYSSQNRWVEPMGRQVRRTLADNLEARLRPDAVVGHPWFATDGVALQVEIAFDPIRLGDAGAWMGSGAWVVRDGETRAPLERSGFEFELGRDAVPPEEIAQGLSAELDRLSEEIEAAVRRVYGRRP